MVEPIVGKHVTKDRQSRSETTQRCARLMEGFGVFGMAEDRLVQAELVDARMRDHLKSLG